MWVLLQFISGSIQKNALADFLPVMKLFDLLYPEKEVHICQEINFGFTTIIITGAPFYSVISCLLYCVSFCWQQLHHIYL